MSAAITRTVRYRLRGAAAVGVGVGVEEGEAELLEGGVLRPLSGPPVAHLAEVELLPPARPTKIVGVGLNYRAHAAEMGKPLPAEPLLFLKPSTALCAPGRPIVRPRGFERVDFEGELAVVFGRAARRVRAAEALDYVAGYTCLNDVTVRDLQRRDVQYTRAKGFDTFAPCGPCLARGLDPSQLTIVTSVDGEVRQSASTADLIFDVPTLIAAVTRVMTMLPGDIIATGTPSGVGPIVPGTTVTITITGIGVLENPVVEEDE